MLHRARRSTRLSTYVWLVRERDWKAVDDDRTSCRDQLVFTLGAEPHWHHHFDLKYDVKWNVQYWLWSVQLVIVFLPFELEHTFGCSIFSSLIHSKSENVC